MSRNSTNVRQRNFSSNGYKYTRDSIDNSSRTYERIDELQHREDVETGTAEARAHQPLIAHLATDVTASHHENQRVVSQHRYQNQQGNAEPEAGLVQRVWYP